MKTAMRTLRLIEDFESAESELVSPAVSAADAPEIIAAIINALRAFANGKPD